jgi:hypothetical protein
MKEIITLCSTCYRDFRDNSTRRITRTKKQTKETCTYCNCRMGYDYRVMGKRGRKE